MNREMEKDWNYIHWLNANKKKRKEVMSGSAKNVNQQSRKTLFLILDNGHVHSLDGQTCYGTVIQIRTRWEARTPDGSYRGSDNSKRSAAMILTCYAGGRCKAIAKDAKHAE